MHVLYICKDGDDASHQGRQGSSRLFNPRQGASRRFRLLQCSRLDDAPMSGREELVQQGENGASPAVGLLMIFMARDRDRDRDRAGRTP